MEWHIFICIILKHNLKSCTIIKKNLQTKEIYLYSSCINKVKSYTESSGLCGNIHITPLDTRHATRLHILLAGFTDVGTEIGRPVLRVLSGSCI